MELLDDLDLLLLGVLEGGGTLFDQGLGLFSREGRDSLEVFEEGAHALGSIDDFLFPLVLDFLLEEGEHRHEGSLEEHRLGRRGQAAHQSSHHFHRRLLDFTGGVLITK